MSLAQIFLAGQLPHPTSPSSAPRASHDMQDGEKGMASWETMTKHLILGTSPLVIAGHTGDRGKKRGPQRSRNSDVQFGTGTLSLELQRVTF